MGFRRLDRGLAAHDAPVPLPLLDRVRRTARVVPRPHPPAAAHVSPCDFRVEDFEAGVQMLRVFGLAIGFSPPAAAHVAPCDFRVEFLGFGVYRLRIYGSGFGFRVQGLGFRVQG